VISLSSRSNAGREMKQLQTQQLRIGNNFRTMRLTTCLYCLLGAEENFTEAIRQTNGVLARPRSLIATKPHGS